MKKIASEASIRREATSANQKSTRHVPDEDRVYKVGADGSEEDEAEQRPATVYALDGEILLLRKTDLVGQFQNVRPRRH
jgi:hypothetical protein